MRALKQNIATILMMLKKTVTTQAHEGIETNAWEASVALYLRNNSSPWGHWNFVGKAIPRLGLVTTQAHEGIETEKGAGTETGDEVTTQETPGGQAPMWST